MKSRTSDSRSAPSADASQPSKPNARPSGLVAAGKDSTGFVGYDDLGQPRWSWMTELDPAAEGPDAADVLGALDTSALSLADEAGAAPVRRASKESGYDPYDTARIKVGDRFRRRR